MDKLPILSADLVNKLNELYPLRNPSILDSEKELMFKAGQRSVVESLLSKMRTSEDPLLNNYGD